LTQRDPGSWTLRDLLTAIRDQRALLNPFYTGTPLFCELAPELDFAENHQLIMVYVYTHFNVEPRGIATALKRAFSAQRVNFIEKDGNEPAFWSIELGWTTLPNTPLRDRPCLPLSAVELADSEEGEEGCTSGKAPVFSTAEDLIADLHKKKEASP